MSDDTEKTTAKVKFIFKKSDDYKLHFVNGAYGGFTAHGDLVCNFFFESQAMPTEQEADIEGDKITQITTKSSDIPEFIRDVKFGIIMTPQEVVSLRDWLEKKLKEFEGKFLVGAETCKKE